MKNFLSLNVKLRLNLGYVWEETLNRRGREKVKKGCSHFYAISKVSRNVFFKLMKDKFAFYRPIFRNIIKKKEKTLTYTAIYLLV